MRAPENTRRREESLELTSFDAQELLKQKTSYISGWTEIEKHRIGVC